MIRRTGWAAGLLLAVGCGGPPGSPAMSAAHEAALADSVRAMMLDFADSWSRVSCDDIAPIMRFFDTSGPGVIDGNETAVTLYPGDAFPTLIREGACARVREAATLDSLLVRVLTPDIVTASWTFHAEYQITADSMTRARGAVLQVFRRTPEGWKTPVGMSTHQPMEPATGK